ncbi:DUF3566 domain-containing protein [Pseudonocardia sp. RS010]|uniref:DUF3566 domain-containing protein n=1 Tax=Pseudonocardia sp. RS010 TaxID=3385979 RepID=UPI0039A32A94
MSEKNEPATPPGATDEGRVVTDGPDSPPLPADGAAAPAAASPAEDRTTPASAAAGQGGNGAGPPSANGTASSNGSTPTVSSSATSEEAGSDDGSSARPNPRAAAAATEAAEPAAGEVGESQDGRPGIVPTPPPWRRAQGDEGAEAAEGAEAVQTSRPAPQRSPAVDSLLSEAPTAYIDQGAAPRTGSAGPGAAAGTTTLPGGSRAEVHAEVPNVAGRAPRQALLQVKRFDPWSVLKLALVLAVVLFFIWLVAVGVLYGVLDGMGVWDRLNGTYADLVSGGGEGGGGALISAGSVFGFAAIIGAINSLLFAVAITVGAFVYNVSADLVGGIEVTLSERD